MTPRLRAEEVGVMMALEDWGQRFWKVEQEDQ